jgi:hypothetical protein
MGEEGAVLGGQIGLDQPARIFLIGKLDPPLPREGLDRLAVDSANIGGERRLVGQQRLGRRQVPREQDPREEDRQERQGEERRRDLGDPPRPEAPKYIAEAAGLLAIDGEAGTCLCNHLRKL